MSEAMRLPESYWAASAVPAPDLSPLSRDLETDVVIVGGGFTGLAAAAELLRRGCACVVVEAAEAGWGASGRNGGFVVPRFKKGFAALAETYGHAATRNLHRLVHTAIDLVEATVEEHGVDCGFVRSGNIAAAYGPRAVAALAADRDWLAREAGDAVPRLLDAGEVAEEVGHRLYRGGLLDPRGAMIHPLSYSRGLAAALAARGVPIHVGTPARRLVEDAAGVVVETAGGRIRARRAIVATNGYSDLLQTPYALGRRVVPVSSSAVATAPLPEKALASILPNGRAVADTRYILNYYRRLPDGRILFGGRGDITGRKDTPEIYRGLEAELYAHFPVAAEAGIAYRWSGMVAVTLDSFPHIGRASERVAYAMGYGGRGVALSNLLGNLLGRMAVGEAVDAGLMQSLPLSAIPFHRWRVPGMRAAAAWYRFKDRRDAAVAEPR